MAYSETHSPLERNTTMTKTTKIASALAVVSAVTVVAKFESYVTMLQERFPDLDASRMTLRRAYLRELRNSGNGVYGDIQDYTDEQMDELFLAEVEKIQNKK